MTTAIIYINPKKHICNNCNVLYTNNIAYEHNYYIYNNCIDILQSKKPNKNAVKINYHMLQVCNVPNVLNLSGITTGIDSTLLYGRSYSYDKKFIVKMPNIQWGKDIILSDDKARKVMKDNLPDTLQNSMIYVKFIFLNE